MNDPDKPQLDAIVFDKIALHWHEIGKDYWPKIAALRMPTFIPLSQPVPPRVPHVLLNLLLGYASILFSVEADQYAQFADDPRYPAWLSRLAERVLTKVTDAVEKIDKADNDQMLMVHGLEHHDMVNSIREFLWSMSTNYFQKAMPKVHPVPEEAPKTNMQQAATPQVSAAQAPSESLAPQIERPQIERAALRDTYMSVFPDVGIMDICWAAKQHYREWARWLKDEVKDGSRPDRAFRHVLTSGKTASEIRKEIRPKGWK
jgi:hypothetical protein